MFVYLFVVMITYSYFLHLITVSGLPNGYPGSVLIKVAFASSDDVTQIEDWDKYVYMRIP